MKLGVPAQIKQVFIGVKKQPIHRSCLNCGTYSGSHKFCRSCERIGKEKYNIKSLTI
jgi:hypothetical protein